MHTTVAKPIITTLSVCLAVSSATKLDAQTPMAPAAGIDHYEPGPDSRPQPGVPKGKTFSFTFERSKIFPGSSHTITVYVPEEYKGDKSACVYVNLGSEGFGFGAPIVFDNLIYKGEMPVTIGIGISPGKVASVDADQNPRFGRSFELDGLNDAFARCIIEEIFPEVEKHQTPAGLPIKLSRDPNDHCAGGASTGGIGAFSLAWERPDLFRRVFSAVGTYVGIRGGDRYPGLIRKTEPKPIRVFQQDGENDASTEFGDWWMSNQEVERALQFAGYEHAHVWGNGKHNPGHATAIFPDAMRFLWKDWPKPVQTRKSGNYVLHTILDPDATWQLDSEAGQACDRLAVNPQGEVFFQDAATRRTRKLGAHGRIIDEPAIPADRVFGFAPDGRIVTIADIPATCMAVTSSGRVYATGAETGKIWLIKPDGSNTMLDEGLKRPGGIALSPDGLWLAVMESDTHWGYSYRVKLDGTVDLKQQFFWAQQPDWADGSGAGGMCMDRDGNLYAATHLGVQVFDRNGRCRAILPLPTGEPTSICFGDPNFDTLFVTSGGKLYQRRMKAAGAPSFIAPLKLPPGSPS